MNQLLEKCQTVNVAKCISANKYSDLKNHMATKKNKSNAEIIIGKKANQTCVCPWKSSGWGKNDWN